MPCLKLLGLTCLNLMLSSEPDSCICIFVVSCINESPKISVKSLGAGCRLLKDRQLFVGVMHIST